MDKQRPPQTIQMANDQSRLPQGHCDCALVVPQWCELCIGPNVLFLSEHSLGAELRKTDQSRPAGEGWSVFEGK